jgi:hypothetical protein
MKKLTFRQRVKAAANAFFGVTTIQTLPKEP